ncbi:hypothetical protein GGX14DRAFT_368356 [Mycena pura]|uniref:TNFR-Cys domain-containing protein n=1 Tax=Mycena pura TaxID=153505 RepID=A0AAD6VBM1_9AGAR|nr:hypothetical protein GGX14DRAFT_368356 [Mycena pura]
MYRCLGFFLVVSLALFFGLFFGLNYSEIIRHGWPLTRCTVLSADIATRYCCETSCATGSCKDAPNGSQQCSALISSIDSGYSPSDCASNSSSCPTQIGNTCDGGYYCCSTCCSTCTSCTSICSGNPPSCSESCTDYTCDCYCCSSTNNLYCTLSCPICYNVNLQLLYSSRDGNKHNVSYVQDFSKDVSKANNFFTSHTTNSTSFCYYNPANEAQVLFDVSFTKWKWAITSIFGILPLFVTLGLFVYFLALLPLWNFARVGWSDMRRAVQAKPFPKISLKSLKGRRNTAVVDHSDPDAVDNPPPVYKEREGAN